VNHLTKIKKREAGCLFVRGGERRRRRRRRRRMIYEEAPSEEQLS
jgi:hypothetical protein